MKKVKSFLVILIILLMIILEISVFAYYNFLSPVINVDVITGALINESDLSDYNKVDEVLIPASPEVLEKIENEEYEYNPLVVNYWQKKEKIYN